MHPGQMSDDSGENVLPVELWTIIFSHLHPYSLFTVARVCPLFRGIVWSCDGRLVDGSSEVKPDWVSAPPRLKLPLEEDNSAEAEGIRLLHKYALEPASCGKRRYTCYFGASYVALLFSAGKCTVCGDRTARPVHDIVTLVRVCSPQCNRRLHHENLLVEMPTPEGDQKKKPRIGRWRPEDEYIVSWLPFMKGRGEKLVLVHDLKRARAEYASIKDKTPLPQIYHERTCMLAAMLSLRKAYRLWVRSIKYDHERAYMMNTRFVRKFARVNGIKAALILQAPSVRHAMEAHIDTVTCLTKQSLKHAWKKGHLPCEVCDTFVPEDIWLAHTINRHPEIAPMARHNKETGEDEQRCPHCPKSAKWYIVGTNALQRHMDAKHSTAVQDVEMESADVATSASVEVAESVVTDAAESAHGAVTESAESSVSDADAGSQVLGKRRSSDESESETGSVKRSKHAHIPEKPTQPFALGEYRAPLPAGKSNKRRSSVSEDSETGSVKRSKYTHVPEQPAANGLPKAFVLSKHRVPLPAVKASKRRASDDDTEAAPVKRSKHDHASEKPAVVEMPAGPSYQKYAVAQLWQDLRANGELDGPDGKAKVKGGKGKKGKGKTRRSKGKGKGKSDKDQEGKTKKGKSKKGKAKENKAEERKVTMRRVPKYIDIETFVDSD